MHGQLGHEPPLSAALPGPTLGARLAARRLPPSVALSLATEVVEAVAAVHQHRRSFGRLTAEDFVVRVDGGLTILATSAASSWSDTTPSAAPDSVTDTREVGGVLFHIFTGLTPSQARARLLVTPRHEVPPASRFNPDLDERIEALLAWMLSRDPGRRPHSLRVVEAALGEVCDSLHLQPSRAIILAWASSPAPPDAVKVPRPSAPRHTPTYVAALTTRGGAVKESDVDGSNPGGWSRASTEPERRGASPARKRPAGVPVGISRDADGAGRSRSACRRPSAFHTSLPEGEGGDEPLEAAAAPLAPVRFDAWAVTVCAFCVLAIAVATQL